MSDRFTIVFKGDIRAFDGNPLHVVSPFGEVVAGGVGDEFAVADALRAENARLTKERDNALHRAAEYRDECNSLTNQNRALRAARAAMGESDE